MNKKVVAALLGFGTVGSALARLIANDREILIARTGIDIQLKHIVVRNAEGCEQRALDLGLSPNVFTHNLEDVLRDTEVEIVIELVGGVDAAESIIRQSLLAGKNVVTANKALLAHCGAELYATARERGLSLAFEASCGSGIPIIRAILDGLSANSISAVFGIVNGTCNYILSEMRSCRQEFAEALQKAKNKGLAEADPALDINGSDSAHKVAIMASLAFAQKINYSEISVQGIEGITFTDIHCAGKMGYAVKLFASAVCRAVQGAEGVCIRVEPTLIPNAHPLACAEGVFNAISVYGHITGHTMYYGKGAGGKPTASAVLADIVSIVQGSYPALFNGMRLWPDLQETATLVPPGTIPQRYYIRINTGEGADLPAKVHAKISQLFPELSSLSHGALSSTYPTNSANASVHAQSECNCALVYTTQPLLKERVQEAVNTIIEMDGVSENYSILPIFNGYEEADSNP